MLGELFAKCDKYGKVHNFEGQFALSIEIAHNCLKFWPCIEKLR